MRRLVLLSCITLGSLTTSSAAQFTLFGQDVETTLTMPAWIPPLWAPSLDGTATVRNLDQDVSTGIGEAYQALSPLLQSLDFILMGQAEFRVGDWILRGGLLTVDLSGSKSLVDGQIELKGDLELDYLAGEIGYRLGDFHLNEISPELPSLTLTTDVFAGLRYTRLGGDFGFGIGPGIGGSTDWLDAALGTRVHITSDTPSPLSLTAETHIAGFGSDFTWDFKGLVNYELGKNFIVSGGWKLLYVNYDTTLSGGDFGLDLFLSGPAVELSLRF